jgi:hypothetical protein
MVAPVDRGVWPEKRRRKFAAVDADTLADTLADAVGTVREVVVRVLREFRAEELIRTERDIVILDSVQLSREQGWNQSP